MVSQFSHEPLIDSNSKMGTAASTAVNLNKFGLKDTNEVSNFTTVVLSAMAQPLVDT